MQIACTECLTKLAMLALFLLMGVGNAIFDALSKTLILYEHALTSTASYTLAVAKQANILLYFLSSRNQTQC